MWRHVFEGSERDHMMAEIPSNTPTLEAKQDVATRRVTFGHWVIDGCPHHGAALAVGAKVKIGGVTIWLILMAMMRIKKSARACFMDVWMG
jgi:hypothetical protein